MSEDGSDETEGRKLYRAKADALANAQVNIAKRPVTLALANCPFCGGEGAVARGGFWRIICRDCMACTVICESQTDATAAWNRRP